MFKWILWISKYIQLKRTTLTDVPRHVPAGGAQEEVAQLAQQVGGGEEAEHGGPGSSQG